MTKLKAVADETRVRIVLCLIDQPLCLDHLGRIFDLALSTLSAHLRILSSAGLISVTQEGHWRYYHLRESEQNNISRELLKWLCYWTENDECIEEDLKRRAVAIKESVAPVPNFLKIKKEQAQAVC